LKVRKAIDLLEASIGNPSEGLREDVFLFVSRVTPLINVDLLIKDERHRTLLTWREDAFHVPGWHVPGGIVRYKETLADRIAAVARGELGTRVRFEKQPLAINEIIDRSRADRGHFISLLFECALISPADPGLICRGSSPRSGQWAWHAGCPAKLISVHEIYRPFI
jgi:colanic acid biosynthesis protein WcaH